MFKTIGTASRNKLKILKLRKGNKIILLSKNKITVKTEIFKILIFSFFKNFELKIFLVENCKN